MNTEPSSRDSNANTASGVGPGPDAPEALLAPVSPPSPFNYRAHFEKRAAQEGSYVRAQSGFHRQLAALMRHHVRPGLRVLEIGCGRGDLLAALAPRRGLGIDFSTRAVEAARLAHDDPNLEFRVHDINQGAPPEEFDVIILDYLIGYLPDIQTVLENLRACRHARTRIYLTSLNFAWKPLLGLGTRLGFVGPQPPSNWISSQDLENLLELADWEVVSSRTEQLLPFQWPLVSSLFNRLLVRLPFFRHFGCSLFITAAPRMEPEIKQEVSCSVVIPARNEAGNIASALARVPVLGRKTEIIFVEGNSTDDTWEVIQRECAAYRGPHQVSYCQQPGKGKWDAVHTGFERARGDVLMILDGDLTVPPEDLPKFFDAVASGSAEFANGSRLVYPMESRAMRFLNLLGNKFFALALSFVIGQPIKDSLCGTKVMLASDYRRLLERIEELGDFDPFGDFNLLFGSSLLDLRIRDVPIRYRDRTYGDTNIRRFYHGQILLRMTWFGLWKIRFWPLRTRKTASAPPVRG